MDIESPAGFHARQGAHWPLGNPVFSGYRARDFLFVVLAGLKVLHGPASLLHASQGCFLHPLADPVHVRPEFLQRHLVGPQVSVQAKRIGDFAQRSPENQPIESAQNSLDLVCILRGKLMHGVPFLSYLVNFEHSRSYELAGNAMCRALFFFLAFLASWRETIYYRGHDRKRRSEADRRCRLSSPYGSWPRPAGIGIRSGPGERTAEARTERRPAAGDPRSLRRYSLRHGVSRRSGGPGQRHRGNQVDHGDHGTTQKTTAHLSAAGR